MADEKINDFAVEEVLFESDETSLKILLPDFRIQCTDVIRKHLQEKLIAAGMIIKGWHIHFTYISYAWFDDGAILIKAGASFFDEKGTKMGLVTHPHITRATFKIKLKDEKEWSQFGGIEAIKGNTNLH